MNRFPTPPRKKRQHVFSPLVLNFPQASSVFWSRGTLASATALDGILLIGSSLGLGFSMVKLPWQCGPKVGYQKLVLRRVKKLHV